MKKFNNIVKCARITKADVARIRVAVKSVDEIKKELTNKAKTQKLDYAERQILYHINIRNIEKAIEMYNKKTLRVKRR